MAVGKRTRFEVFKRDQFQCQYCGRNPPAVVLEADHVVPVSEGGPDTMDNLVTACFDCNSGKSNIPLGSVPKPLVQVMAETAEKREQLAEYSRFLMEQRAEEDAQVERLSKYWLNKELPPKKHNQYVFTDDGRITTFRTFLRRLPEALILEAIDIAAGRINGIFGDDQKRWRYFCGVCWKKIRDAEGN